MIDFALAVGSNGRVDAPDIKHPKRVTGLPVPVREMHATLVWRDQHELLNQVKCLRPTSVGQMYMVIRTSARKIASAAVASHHPAQDGGIRGGLGALLG